MHVQHPMIINEGLLTINAVEHVGRQVGLCDGVASTDLAITEHHEGPAWTCMYKRHHRVISLT